MKPKLIFDFDSTITESIQAICHAYVNRHYNEIMEGLIPMPLYTHIRRWNMEDELPMMTEQELLELFDSEEFFNFLGFITDPSGLSMSNLIADLIYFHSCDIHIASKGHKRNLELKRDWIINRIPYFDINNFEGMLGTTMDKSSLEGLILIDDCISNLYSAMNVKYKILFAHRGNECEWNSDGFKDGFETGNFYICKSVKELYDRIMYILDFEKIR